MPIGAVAAREGPRNRLDRQALDNVGVLVDVERIVIVDEAELGRLTEDEQDRQQKQAADGQLRGAALRPPVASSVYGRRRGDETFRRAAIIGFATHSAAYRVRRNARKVSAMYSRWSSRRPG